MKQYNKLPNGVGTAVIGHLLVWPCTGWSVLIYRRTLKLHHKVYWFPQGDPLMKSTILSNKTHLEGDHRIGLCPSMCVSICLSILPFVKILFLATPSTSFIGLIWSFAECFLMIWRCAYVFIFFVFGLFWWSYGPCWLQPCPYNFFHIFETIQNVSPWSACVYHIFDKVMALGQFWHFFNFWTLDREDWFLVW